jgi:hypothetical protein
MYRRGSVSLDPGSAPFSPLQRGQGKRKTNVQGFLRSEELGMRGHHPTTPSLTQDPYPSCLGVGHSGRCVLVALQHQRQLVGENLHQLG